MRRSISGTSSSRKRAVDRHHRDLFDAVDALARDLPLQGGGVAVGVDGHSFRCLARLVEALRVGQADVDPGLDAAVRVRPRRPAAASAVRETASREGDSRLVLQAVGEHPRQHVLHALGRVERHAEREGFVDVAVGVVERDVEVVDGGGEGHVMMSFFGSLWESPAGGGARQGVYPCHPARRGGENEAEAQRGLMDADGPGADRLRTCRCRERPDREEDRGPEFAGLRWPQSRHSHAGLPAGIKDPACASIEESIAAGVRDATDSSPEEWVKPKMEGGRRVLAHQHRLPSDLRRPRPPEPGLRIGWGVGPTRMRRRSASSST